MGRRFSILLLLLLAPGAAVSLLRYRYDCGDYGMQLLAYPPHGRTLRFTVLDEFGTRFEVANCSICLHWLNAGVDGAVVFSSGYEGCHVLLKEDRYVLRVQVEEMLLGGVLAASYEVNMTCPHPGGDYETLTHNTRGESSATRGDSAHQPQAGVLVPLSQPGLAHGVSQSSLTRPGPQISAQGHSEQGHPVARTQPVLGGWPRPQPSLLHPGLQPHNQPILGHPGAPNQPGLLRPGLQTQNQPGLVHGGPQNQPGFLHLGPQTPNQPGLVHGGPQNQPGFLHLGPQTPNQPGLVHGGPQNQPSRLHPGLQTPNQPGLQHPGAQSRPGLLRPGLQTPNQPGLLPPNLQTQTQHGLVHPGVQNQAGLLRPGLQTSNQPGLQHPGVQNQAGLLRPGLQTSNQPGLQHHGVQNQAGLLRPGFQTPNQPGLQLSGSQSQPGLLHPNLQTPNHPGLQHPGSQSQAGHLRPGFQTQNQPGLGGVPSGFTPAGAQTQGGFVRPGAQPQNQPGVTRPSLQTQSQTGLLRPGLQSQAGLVHPGHSRPALAHPGLSSRPGLVRPGLQAQLQPGLAQPGLQPQPQPGVLRPGLQSQPSLLQSTALFYPSPGAGTPLTREQCQVAVGRMPCVAPPGREACLQAGCCYDDMDRVAPCYYGNTATVQCLLEGHFVLVVPRGLAPPQPYNPDSVRLASGQPGCEPVRVTETFVMFHFPVTQCGTTVQVIEDQLIYENQLISTIDVQGSARGSITRDSILILQARCIYNASDLLPLRMEVAVPPTAAPLAEPGPLGLQLRIATDESYSSYHAEGDYPLVKVLRDPIYVEVRLLQKTDPNLVLVLHQCWASPSTDATAQPQWPILVDGCPFAGDNYRTQLVPVGPASPQLPFPSHYQRFVLSTFTFVEPPSMAVLEGEVYISCSASVCHLAQPEPCRPSCQLGATSRARRSPRDRRTAEGVGTVTSQGRITFPQVPTLQRG